MYTLVQSRKVFVTPDDRYMCMWGWMPKRERERELYVGSNSLERCMWLQIKEMGV
jgi:hypothetical protein